MASGHSSPNWVLKYLSKKKKKNPDCNPDTELCEGKLLDFPSATSDHLHIAFLGSNTCFTDQTQGSLGFAPGSHPTPAVVNLRLGRLHRAGTMLRVTAAQGNMPITSGQAPQTSEGHQTPFNTGWLSPPSRKEAGQAAQPEAGTEAGTW